MTATTTNELAAPSGPVAVLQRSMPRDQFFAGLYIVGCANGLLGRIIQSLRFDGWIGAILSVDINVIVLFAAFAGVSALLSEKSALPGETKDEIGAADL